MSAIIVSGMPRTAKMLTGRTGWGLMRILPPAANPPAAMTKRKCRLFLVDAFTRERYCGNPAVVVLDADVLEEQEMRRIARELAGFAWHVAHTARPT